MMKTNETSKVICSECDAEKNDIFTDLCSQCEKFGKTEFELALNWWRNLDITSKYKIIDNRSLSRSMTMTTEIILNMYQNEFRLCSQIESCSTSLSGRCICPKPLSDRKFITTKVIADCTLCGIKDVIVDQHICSSNKVFAEFNQSKFLSYVIKFSDKDRLSALTLLMELLGYDPNKSSLIKASDKELDELKGIEATKYHFNSGDKVILKMSNQSFSGSIFMPYENGKPTIYLIMKDNSHIKIYDPNGGLGFNSQISSYKFI